MLDGQENACFHMACVDVTHDPHDPNGDFGCEKSPWAHALGLPSWEDCGMSYRILPLCWGYLGAEERSSEEAGPSLKRGVHSGFWSPLWVPGRRQCITGRGGQETGVGGLPF